MNNMGGLLAHGNPIMDIGMGLLSASGPSAQPVSFGQAIGQAGQFASQRDQARMQNEFMRSKLSQQQTQQQAMGRIRSLLDTGDINTPEGQNLLPGLLSEVAPEQFAQQMMGQIFPQEQNLRGDAATMQALGLELTPENYGFFQQLKSAPNREQEELMQRIQLQQAETNVILAQQRADENRRNREREERDETTKRQAQERSVLRTSSDIMEAFDLVDRLEESILTEPGLGADTLRRLGLQGSIAIGRLRDLDTSAQERLLTDKTRLEQISTGFVFDNLERLKGAGIITQGKFETLQKTLIDPNSTPEAIKLALADIGELNLNLSRDEKIDLPAADKLREKIAIARGDRQTVRTGAEPARVTPGQIRTFTAEQLSDIDVRTLDADGRKAMEARLRALGLL